VRQNSQGPPVDPAPLLIDTWEHVATPRLAVNFLFDLLKLDESEAVVVVAALSLSTLLALRRSHFRA
jgi:hypothetical protein